MTYTKQNEEGRENVFVLNIEADGADFDAALGRVYEKNKESYQLQGFRKGKVPRKVLEGVYGKSVFYEDAIDLLLPEYYEEVLTKEGIDPVARPEVEVLSVGESGLKLKITVTTLKSFTVGQYKGLTLKKAVFEVTDEDIKKQLSAAQDKAARIISVDNRPAQNGDTVIIDYSGSVDGVKFNGGTAEKQDLELGSGMFIPGFEAQVEGLKIGESRDINVKFPEDYGAENLAGKDAVFAVTLHEIKAKEIPGLDDEFAKDVSEFDTLEQYKDDIRKKLETENAQKEKDADEKLLLDTIIDGTVDMEVPDMFVEKECESLLKQFEYRLMYQGLKIKDYYNYTGQSEEQVRESYKEAAIKNVKTRLILEKIIELEQIKLDTDKLDARMNGIAEAAKVSLEDYKKKINPGQYDYYANEVLTGSLFEFLNANNTFAELC